MESEISRRSLLKGAGGLLFLGAGGSLLGACSSSSSAGTSTTHVVRSANNSGALALDPGVGADEGTFTVKRHVFSTVTKVDQVSGTVTPWLLSGLPKQLDSHTWQLSVKPNVKFQDGSPLTASDVAYSLNRLNSKSLNSIYANIFGGWTMTAKGDTTVVLELDKPFAFVLNRLGQLAVVPEALIKKIGDKAYGLKPVGSGPFRFVSWPGASQAAPITLKRASAYSLGELPSIAGVAISTILDDTARLTALQSGSIDLSTAVAPNLFSGLSGVGKSSANGSEYDAIMMNNNRAPFNDKRVRMALAHAIDRDAIIKAVWKGFAQPAYGPLPPWHWASNPHGKKLEYNVDTAKSLLRQAGYTSGGPEIELMFPNSSTSTAMGTIVTSQLSAVGFKVKPKTGEVNSLYSTVLTKNPTFQAFAMYGNTGLFGYDPDIWYRWLYYGIPGTFLNVTHAQQDPIDKAIDAAAAVDAADRDAQKKAYFALQDMLAEECEMVHIDTRNNLQSWSNNLQGYSVSVDNIPDLNAVSWK